MPDAYPDAFFLYAEIVRPSVEHARESLAAYRLCARGTHAATPEVVTYHFRIDERLTRIHRRTWPESCSTESLELYLTPAGFRDHGRTGDFLAGIRHLQEHTRLRQIRIFWIGPRPAPDMLRGIFWSDRRARPLGTLRCTTFDSDVARRARLCDMAELSVGLDVRPDAGAASVEAVDALAEELVHVSVIAFFHPERRDELRIVATLPIDDAQSPQDLARLLAGLSPASDGGVSGHLQLHRDTPRAPADIEAALAGRGLSISVASDGYEGYVLHPDFAAEEVASHA